MGSRRYLAVWLVPLVWVGIEIGAARYRGDEYGALLMASLAAWPLGFLLASLRLHHSVGMLGAVLICGLPAIALLGGTMDRVGAPLKVAAVIWIVLAAAVAWTGIREYPTLGQAVSKNGSLWAYVFAGLGFALPIACLVSIVGGFLTRRLDRAAQGGSPS